MANSAVSMTPYFPQPTFRAHGWQKSESLATLRTSGFLPSQPGVLNQYLFTMCEVLSPRKAAVRRIMPSVRASYCGSSPRAWRARSGLLLWLPSEANRRSGLCAQPHAAPRYEKSAYSLTGTGSEPCIIVKNISGFLSVFQSLCSTRTEIAGQVTSHMRLTVTW
jgi:hypothetical protein